MEDKERFIKHVNDNYQTLYLKFKKYCKDNQLNFTDDIFQDTILKCFESIERKGKLNDSTPYGIESYFFISLKQNIKREAQYARNVKRDCNVTSDNINDIYEEFLAKHCDSSRVKLIGDLYKDFAVLYILHRVEEQFDEESSYLFRLKYLIREMTYKKLQQITNSTRTRQKVVNVKMWLREHITTEEVKEAFMDVYGDIL